MTWAAMGLALLVAVAAKRAPEPARCGPAKAAADKDEAAEVWTGGAVTAGGTAIDYCAVAGTLIVHPRGWDDAAAKQDAEGEDKTAPATAAMFYAAYFRRQTEPRPVTFLFNGGPGSASLWLHMGAFGPRRVETSGTAHAPAAPYRLVNNNDSLLDVSDLVFVDAPGTGFGRIAGTDKEKAFYGIDEDAHAFAAFIAGFLSKYRRWNVPKYVFGESYGTARAAVLANMLQTDPGIDFNGVILLSPVLAGDLWPDDPRATPGNDLPYALSLPSFAAAAWYHAQNDNQKQADVPPALLAEAEQFAIGDYAAALAAGGALSAERRETIAAALHALTGLPLPYLRKSDLRVGIDAFRQELLHAEGLAVGATDSRYSGFALDRAGKRAGYDPTDAATASAFVSSFNDYARRVLLYGDGKTYRPGVDNIGEKWNYKHQTPDGEADAGANVLGDLARAMKVNPLLKVQVNAGYFDLLTPYFQGRYEMRHLPVPPALRDNIEYRCYQAGHMPYLRPDARARLHDNVADFIERTSNLPAGPGPKRAIVPGCPPEG